MNIKITDLNALYTKATIKNLTIEEGKTYIDINGNREDYSNYVDSMEPVLFEIIEIIKISRLNGELSLKESIYLSSKLSSLMLEDCFKKSPIKKRNRIVNKLLDVELYEELYDIIKLIPDYEYMGSMIDGYYVTLMDSYSYKDIHNTFVELYFLVKGKQKSLIVYLDPSNKSIFNGTGNVAGIELNNDSWLENEIDLVMGIIERIEISKWRRVPTPFKLYDYKSNATYGKMKALEKEYKVKKDVLEKIEKIHKKTVKSNKYFVVIDMINDWLEAKYNIMISYGESYIKDFLCFNVNKSIRYLEATVYNVETYNKIALITYNKKGYSSPEVFFTYNKKNYEEIDNSIVDIMLLTFKLFNDNRNGTEDAIKYIDDIDPTSESELYMKKISKYLKEN